MDLDSHNKLDDYRTILTDYLGNTAWYLGANGLPMISTFDSGNLSVDVLAGNLALPPISKPLFFKLT